MRAARIAYLAPAALGQGYTAMRVCNAGKVSVEASVMLEGKADCENHQPHRL
jgi:hypothetical protein